MCNFKAQLTHIVFFIMFDHFCWGYVWYSWGLQDLYFMRVSVSGLFCWCYYSINLWGPRLAGSGESGNYCTCTPTSGQEQLITNSILGTIQLMHWCEANPNLVSPAGFKEQMQHTNDLLSELGACFHRMGEYAIAWRDGRSQEYTKPPARS